MFDDVQESTQHARKPATKYAHLRKKMQQQKVQVRQMPGRNQPSKSCNTPAGR